jgi:lipopolysaccharide export system permease protein
MIKTYELYLIKLFFKKIINIFLLFLFLIIILSIFDEISFFKSHSTSTFFPLLMACLNAPSVIFEIFPFIFLISTQFFFLDLINKNELEFLKVSSLNNLKIIKVLFLTSFLSGIILLSLYYSFSAKLKFLYLDLKNSYANDNKYLAVVKDSGLWIKDEINNKVYIINANQIKGDYLIQVSINEFGDNFDLIRIIESDKVDVSKTEWVIFAPKIIKNNEFLKPIESMKLNTHFNQEKINSMFENLSSLNIIELIKLDFDYKSLGYSTLEINSHLHKLYSFPLYLSLMTLLSSIIMLNIKKNKPMVFHLLLGIFLSVLIYYFYYLFSIMGVNGKIPIVLSVYLPFVILTFFVLIGLVRINEK